MQSKIQLNYNTHRTYYIRRLCIFKHNQLSTQMRCRASPPSLFSVLIWNTNFNVTVMLFIVNKKRKTETNSKFACFEHNIATEKNARD